MNNLRRGVTLIELMVVIAVIGILVTITVVVYGGTQDRSRTATAESAGLSVLTKAETVRSATSQYPTAITGSGGFDVNPDSSLNERGIVLASITGPPVNPQTVMYESCGSGAKVSWWNYQSSELIQRQLGQPCMSYTLINGTP